MKGAPPEGLFDKVPFISCCLQLQTSRKLTKVNIVVHVASKTLQHAYMHLKCVSIASVTFNNQGRKFT